MKKVDIRMEILVVHNQVHIAVWDEMLHLYTVGTVRETDEKKSGRTGERKDSCPPSGTVLSILLWGVNCIYSGYSERD